jgi:hypothetical protein
MADFMNDARPQPGSPEELQTRFLYPFSFQRQQVKEACEALLKTTHAGREGETVNIWECAEPHSLYQEELLEHVVRFLFPREQGECGYLKLSAPVANAWFNKVEVPLQGREGKSPVRVRMLSTERAELFLSRYGVGVLSIALSLDTRNSSFEECLDFNYRLSQGRPHTAGYLRVPHPSDDAQRWEKLSEAERARIAAVPAPDSNLSARLGKLGGAFSLYEIAEELLRPLTGCELRAVQSEFAIYTVARFGSEVDFGIPETSLSLGPFLSALVQIEEPGHAGAPSGQVAVANAILNRRHWAGAGLLGAAHLLANQSPVDQPFNSSRVPRVMFKYFIPHLMALMQRLVLLRSVEEAGALVNVSGAGLPQGLAALRQQLLEFALRGYFTEVSVREALHRYYRLAQKGLGVPNALEDARRSIADLDGKFAADNQLRLAEDLANNVAATNKLQKEMTMNVVETKRLQQQMTRHLKVVANVQTIVEWLEIFIVSVYAADLWHMFSDRPGWLPPWAGKIFSSSETFRSWSILWVALIAGSITFLIIRGWRHSDDEDEDGLMQQEASKTGME